MENAKQQINDLILSRDKTNIELAYQLAESVGLLHWLENELLGLTLEDIQEFEKMGIDILAILIHTKKSANLLEELSLETCQNTFTEVPKAIQKFGNLKSLSLAENALNSIPVELCCLTKLETLWICNNRIKFLPAEISQLTQLKAIELGGNPWENLEQDLGKLPATIESLQLGCLNLKTVPQGVYRFTQLKKLYLFENDLAELPIAFLGELKNLEVIYLQYNKYFKFLSEDIYLLSSLKKLHLNKAQLSYLPENIRTLSQLQFLGISDNPILDIEKELQKIKHLPIKTLDISNLKITEFPTVLFEFKQLKNLYLSNNLLEMISFVDAPQIFVDNLEDLCIDSNPLKEIEGLNRFVHLKLLNLGETELTQPLEIDKLVNLEWLGLPPNTAQLPFLVNFPNLKSLALWKNQAAVPYYKNLLPHCEVW